MSDKIFLTTDDYKKYLVGVHARKQFSYLSTYRGYLVEKTYDYPLTSSSKPYYSTFHAKFGYLENIGCVRSLAKVKKFLDFCEVMHKK